MREQISENTPPTPEKLSSPREWVAPFPEVKKALEAGTWPFETPVDIVFKDLCQYFEQPPTAQEFTEIITGEKTIEEVKTTQKPTWPFSIAVDRQNEVLELNKSETGRNYLKVRNRTWQSGPRGIGFEPIKVGDYIDIHSGDFLSWSGGGNVAQEGDAERRLKERPGVVRVRVVNAGTEKETETNELSEITVEAGGITKRVHDSLFYNYATTPGRGSN